MNKFNSKIKIKYCNCSPDCKRYPTKYCGDKNYNCLTDEEKQVIGTRNKLFKKKQAYNNAQKRMIHIAQNKVSEDAQKLVLWFKYQMQVSKKVCENCGASLDHYTEKEWYGSQHHIIEKKLCPSVASHPQNHLVLGFWCCHSQWHTSWLNSSKMPCFEEAKRKYQLFKDCIVENEFKNVNIYLSCVP